MVARIFAILAAAFLVTAIGIAALLSFGLTLEQGVKMLNPANVDWLRTQSPAWAWNWVEIPFLQRPLWLVPACLGVICAGIATSCNFGKPSTTRRRRS